MSCRSDRTSAAKDSRYSFLEERVPVHGACWAQDLRNASKGASPPGRRSSSERRRYGVLGCGGIAGGARGGRAEEAGRGAVSTPLAGDGGVPVDRHRRLGVSAQRRDEPGGLEPGRSRRAHGADVAIVLPIAA